MWILLNEENGITKMEVFHKDIRNIFTKIGWDYRIFETEGLTKNGNSIKFTGIEYKQFIPCCFMNNDSYENISSFTVDMGKIVQDKVKSNELTKIISERDNDISLKFFTKKSLFSRKEKKYCTIKLNGLILSPKQKVSIETNNYFIEER